MNDRPLILITNDDGVEAKGIKELTECLRDLGDIVVFSRRAPFGNGKRDHFACADQVYIGEERKRTDGL
jgi:hypothetical protein